MHGAILSDTYSIPWIMVATGKQIDLWKWEDWAQSVQINLSVNRIYSGHSFFTSLAGKKGGEMISIKLLSSQLNFLKKTKIPICSKESVRKSRSTELLNRLNLFKTDYQSGLYD